MTRIKSFNCHYLENTFPFKHLFNVHSAMRSLHKLFNLESVESILGIQISKLKPKKYFVT